MMKDAPMHEHTIVMSMVLSNFLCTFTVLFSYCVASGHCQVSEDKHSQVYVNLHASTNDTA